MGIGGVNTNNVAEGMEIDDRYSDLPQSPPPLKTSRNSPPPRLKTSRNSPPPLKASRNSPPPLKTSRNIKCFSACFRPSSSSSSGHHPSSSSRSLTRSSTTSWVRSKVNELPEGICRCAGLGSPSGRSRHSAEFRYDPLSYSLNFDEEAAAQDESPTSAAEQIRYLRCFSSRLQASPPGEPKNQAAALRFAS